MENTPKFYFSVKKRAPNIRYPQHKDRGTTIRRAEISVDPFALPLRVRRGTLLLCFLMLHEYSKSFRLSQEEKC
ncbi:MAG: hypothetical protein LUC17_04140, partial [Oscillospiraceae bacterium]|nr:hypothetical protein [Oscillospiraceae bacterium]